MKLLFLLFLIALGAIASLELRAEEAPCENKLLLPDVPLLTTKILDHIILGDIVVETGRVPGKSYSQKVPQLDGGMHSQKGFKAFLEMRSLAEAPIESVEQAAKNPRRSAYSHQVVGGKTISKIPTFTMITDRRGISELTLPEEALSYRQLSKLRGKIESEKSGLFSSQTKVITLFPHIENLEEKIPHWINRVLDGKNTRKELSEDKMITIYWGWIKYNSPTGEHLSFKMKVVADNTTNKVVTAYPTISDLFHIEPAEAINNLGLAISLAKDNSLVPMQKLKNYSVDLINHLYQIDKTELSPFLKPQLRKALFRLRDSDASPEKTFKGVYKIFSKVDKTPKFKETYAEILRLIERQENYD